MFLKGIVQLADGIAGDNLRARLARGAATALVINVFGIGLAFLSHLVLARVLGADGYGIYAYVFAWVSVLSLLSTLGFRTALLRFVAAYHARQQWALLRGVVRFAKRTVPVAGIAVAAGGMAVVWLLSDRLDVGLVRAFFVGLAIVPVLALMRVQSSIVRAFGGVVAALAPDLALREATVLVVVAVLAFGLAINVAPPVAMAAMLAGSTLSLTIVSISMRRRYPAPARKAGIAEHRREWLQVSVLLLILHGANLIKTQAGVLLLGWLDGTTSAGIYAIVMRLELLVAFPLSVVNVVFAPTISALHARGERAALQAAVTMTTFWISLTAVLIWLPLFIWPAFWLGLFGPEFEIGAAALRITLVGQLVNAATGSVGFLMTMTGQERRALVLAVLAMSTHLALAAALIPTLGLEGAALAESFIVAAGNIAAVILVWRTLGIMPGPLFWSTRSSA